MRWIFAATCTLLIFAPSELPAQPDPIASEFPINVYTTSYQYGSAVAMNRSGRFVVVWQSYEQDGENSGIFARRFDSSGMPMDAAGFQVNTFTTSFQSAPRVGIRRNGDFVVVWEGYGPGDDRGIFMRRFASSGLALESQEFRVNVSTSGRQNAPDIAVLENGRFLVAWHAPDGYGNHDIGLRRFDRGGRPMGGPFTANVRTSSYKTRPSIGMDRRGDFVVAWEDSGFDGSGDSIAARRFSSSGSPLDAQEFLVNTYTTSIQSSPRIAVAPGGAFVVVWKTYGQDGDHYGVAARRFTRDGTPKDAGDFLVNEIATGAQNNAEIAMDKSGGFVVTWDDFYEVSARRFDSTGSPLEPTEFSVNTYTTANQYSPAITMDRAGRFIVTWSGDGDHDIEPSGISAQKFDCEDTDGDGLCDALDIFVSSHLDGDSVDCATPGIASTRPLFTWQTGNYDRFRAVVSWTSNFAKGTKISSGAALLKRNRWKPSRKLWRRACNNASPDLHVRIFGVDNQLGRKHPHKRTTSPTVSVQPTF